MNPVYVTDRNGHPLMPTFRFGKVRKMLQSGRARVIKRCPFTIQLKEETSSNTQPLVLGIDPGRENIGLAVTDTEGNCVYSAKVITRNKDIPKLMESRKACRMLRRQHRREKKRRRAVACKQSKGVFLRLLPGTETPIECHDIKNKEARFNNRKRPEGWLTPTARHLLQTHLNLIKKVMEILPITDISMEVNKFAFLRMEHPEASGIDFQNGPLKGYMDVHDAIRQSQHGRCLLCGGEIQHYHHIVQRKDGGANIISNLVGLCSSCHRSVHKDRKEQKRLLKLKSGQEKKFKHLSVLNQIIPYLWKALEEEHIVLHATDGYETSCSRELSGLTKDHDIDAYVIACNGVGIEPQQIYVDGFRIRQYRRHCRAAIHQNFYDRVYLENGKAVAVNRHKAADQTKGSLEEYRNTHTQEEVSRLTVRPHGPVYKLEHKFEPGSIFVHEGRCFVLDGYQGTRERKGERIPMNCVDVEGRNHSYIRCEFKAGNAGLVYV